MKHVITESVENQLVNLIIQYAEENRLTASNISEAVKKAGEYMRDNAVLEKGQVVASNAKKDEKNEDKPQLTEKDLHCIARQLQSAWRAPEQETISTYRMFYGCWYCKYSHECKTPITHYFKTALYKLEKLTGVNVFPPNGNLAKTFLPASIFIRHPEELRHLKEHHPNEYASLQEYLNELISHSKESAGSQQDNSFHNV